MCESVCSLVKLHVCLFGRILVSLLCSHDFFCAFVVICLNIHIEGNCTSRRGILQTCGLLCFSPLLSLAYVSGLSVGTGDDDQEDGGLVKMNSITIYETWA